MRRVLIYIGGPSRSGKSRLARSISEATSLKHVDLDKCEKIRNLRATRNDPNKAKYRKHLAATCILNLADHSVIEGNHLWPNDIANPEIDSILCTSLFLGYPNISASKKLSELEARGFLNAKHISELAPADRLKKIEKYIGDSRKMQKSAKENGVEFVDFSTWDEFEATKEKLISRISCWLDS